MKPSHLALTIALATAALPALPAFAQTQGNPLAQREAQLAPILSWLQTKGVSLTFLGEEGGLRGYLGESADGKMQTFYVTPDGQHVILGLLFKNGGTNQTGVQIGEMRARFDAAAKELGAGSVSDPVSGKALPKAESFLGGNAATAKPETPKDSQAPSPKTEPNSSTPAPAPTPAPVPVAPAPAPAPAAEAQAGGLALPSASGPITGAVGDPSSLWVSKLDRKVFLDAAEATPFFEVGALSAKPVLWMVADPRCPFCHKTWDRIRPLIYAKKLRVRVVLIPALSGSEPIAREILASPAPGRAWLDSDAGRAITEAKVDKNSDQWVAAGMYLSKNMEFAKRFGIDRTPFLAYVGDNGNFYSALGLPSDLDGFLAATGAL